ncbi:hypothetical protein HMPREF0326_01797 [Desulfovibrio sp. 3_1_syn3]|uniref:TraK family protein n=1 Tax=Desulfovibrio sp. 3_1_syn3 TaxID=457398 RepID=UPI0001E12756|nr:TraK family protein [Desulfovibrio sp. 3_1_syn3]EFL86094.1 hypothetical protein HMPREF0326_01797 [Desulfovibrio sp. 3_1_syn3]
MKEKPRIKPGMPGAARVEYFACREEVESMQTQGYTVRSIYEHLKGQGRVTCSYSAFCDYVRGGGKRKHSNNGKPPVLRTEPRKGPIMVPGSVDHRKAFDMSAIDISTLI